MVVVANVTITLLLMRHGLSCSNVLSACAKDRDQIDTAFAHPSIFAAIDRELKPTRFARANGYGESKRLGDDCTLMLEDHDGVTTKVRLHDAYRDPALTDCGSAPRVPRGDAVLGSRRSDREREKIYKRESERENNGTKKARET